MGDSGEESHSGMLDTNFLIASLIWGSVGVGYCIYARKERQWVPLTGGIVMIAASYLCASALIMSLICIAAMVGVYWLAKQGY
jgi:uncharacterized membrane protein HdeD (DUF308 family)